MKSIIFRISLLLGFTFFGCQAYGAAETLYLTSPPRETPQEAEVLFGPLAAHLSKLTGMNIVYKHPGDWVKYQRDMRRGLFDIVFDGPHFASWRIKYKEHVPVAKLPGTLRFYLVVMKTSEAINKPKNLAAKKVCVLAPPNLSSLILLALTDGPAREPVLESIDGGFDDVYQGLVNKKCEAAMLPDRLVDKKLTEQQRAELKIIYTSETLPNQVITVSNKFSVAQQQQITNDLTQGEGVAITQPLITVFGDKGTTAFVNVLEGEYKGYSILLEGAILGWRPKREP